MIRDVSTVDAFVLAGGKSSRMGVDKAFLVLGGRSLLNRVLQLAKMITEQVTIVGDPLKFAAFGPVVQDVFTGRGPLGGIHAALATSNAELHLILGVDLPFLNTTFLNYLVAQAKSSLATITVPFAAGGYQPLCAVYRSEFADVAGKALHQRRNKIDALFPQVSLRTIDEGELRQAGFSNSIFQNVNTPKDWEQAKRQFESEHL
jgi:molybdenum cofactor guanylyltransferase